MKIAVIGRGNVGAVLGAAWARAGHQVVFGTLDGAPHVVVSGVSAAKVSDAIYQSDVITLAVPWAAVADVLRQADCTGKTVIDCTNPISTGFQLAVGFNSSGAEHVKALVPSAKVVKAFNITGFNVMQNPRYKGQGITMLYCTDDEDTKKTIEQLVRDVGFEPEFAGPLRQARYLEPLAMLWITMSQKIGRDFAFNVVRL